MTDGSITLYFGLRADEKADLEIVAKAAIKWVEAMRAAAHDFDPDSNFRVELIDAQESSLKINAILDWAENQLSRLDVGASKYWRLRQLAISLVVFVVVSGVPTYHFYFDDKSQIPLSEEDRQRLDTLIEHLSNNPDVEEKKSEFYNTINQDSAITEVGLSENSQKEPFIKVPKNQFAERGGLFSIQEEEDERTTYKDIEVKLVAPMLVASKRAWRFASDDDIEFTAKMRDENFLKALEQNHVKEQLRIGIVMKIRLKIDEKKIGGNWVLKHGGKSVIQVLEPKLD